MRHGDPEPYLAHAARRGHLQVADDPTAAKQRLLEDWWQTARHELDQTVMLAYRRADVRDLNDAAHLLMLRAGRLGPEAVELGGREFRVGDRVLCRRNYSSLGVRNGTRATVTAFDRDALTLRADNGATRHLPLMYARDHLEHGYALTGHSAQGATVERAYVLLPDQGAIQEWGYVACTRARSETHLYLSEHDALERETPLRHLNRTTAPERTARALERSSAEQLALDQARTGRDASTRLHARRHEQLEQQRARAADRLASAQRELKQLGWWNRGNRRVELEREISFQQTALRGFDEKRTELARTPPAAPRVRLPGRERDELTPTRSLLRERTLQREPPGRGLEL
jgi:hypothetical protein